jgi:hypothetical protein
MNLLVPTHVGLRVGRMGSLTAALTRGAQAYGW